MSAALAAAMLVSAVAVPVFAEGSNTMQYYYDKTDGAYKTQTNKDTPVGADNIADPKLTTQGQTVVKYEVHESYEWSIPSVIDFGSDAGYIGDIGRSVYVDTQGGEDDDNNNYIQNNDSKVMVTKNVLPFGKKLVITAKGSGADGAFKMKSTATNGGTKGELNYKVRVSKDGTYKTLGDESNGCSYEVLAVPSGTNNGETLLQFVLSTYLGGNTTAEYADKYEGAVIFTATVEDA